MSNRGNISGKGKLEFVRIFPTTRENVWAYLVEDKFRRKWICGGEVEARSGGRIVFDFDHQRLSSQPAPEKYADQSTIRFEGEVLVYEPPERLEFSWPEADGKSFTTVKIGLTSVTAGTEMRLIHENLNSDEYRMGASAGWHAHLDILGDILGNYAPRDFWEAHTEAERHYTNQQGDRN